MSWKKKLKKFWHFIWEDDSVLSWIVNVVLAFVIIKFLVYPGLGFIVSTTHPVVAVVSGSMEHKTVADCLDRDQLINGGICLDREEDEYKICGEAFHKKQDVDLEFFWDTCGLWYRENANLSEKDFKEFPYKNGFNTGDIMLLRGTSIEKIELGDVIVYWSTRIDRRDPIIHRVVRIYEVDDQIFIQTKGDHNYASNPDEKAIAGEQIIGKAYLRVPYLGWIKIAFVDAVRWVRDNVLS